MNKWDKWKEHENLLEREIFRMYAEQEQLETRPSKIEGFKEVIVRGEYQGLIHKNLEVYLRLDMQASPRLTIKNNLNQILAIIYLEPLKTKE